MNIACDCWFSEAFNRYRIDNCLTHFEVHCDRQTIVIMNVLSFRSDNAKHIIHSPKHL